LVDTQPQAQAFAASDEALVNPAAEVNAAQTIQSYIDAERSAPAAPLAAADEVLVNSVAEVNAAEMIQSYIDAERSAPAAPLAAADEALVNSALSEAVDWEGLGGPYEDGTVADYYIQETPQRTPQQNVSIR